VIASPSTRNPLDDRRFPAAHTVYRPRQDRFEFPSSMAMAPARKILYVQYTNPGAYPPLQNSSRLLADQGWRVHFLGVGLAAVAGLRLPSHPHITLQQIPSCPPGWWQKLHYLGYTLWVVLTALLWRPDCVYLSDLHSCPIGLLLSILSRLCLIYHEHDSPGEATGVFFRLCIASRRYLAQRATLSILPNRGRVETLVRAIGNAAPVPYCVWNCPGLHEVPAASVARPRDGLRLYYHGNVSPVLLPLTILEALRQLPGSVTLTIVGYETATQGQYLKQYRAQAQRLGVADRLTILPGRPRSELWPIIRTCHVGLALFPLETEELNLKHLAGASNKVFDYLAGGMTVLVPASPEWQTLCVDSGLGLVCVPSDADSIAAALAWFLENPDQTARMGEQGRQRILADWNYDEQFRPILDVLEQVLRRRRPHLLRHREFADDSTQQRPEFLTPWGQPTPAAPGHTPRRTPLVPLARFSGPGPCLRGPRAD
jgi:glycosyltransferase involved in cell wall biosynthesis